MATSQQLVNKRWGALPSTVFYEYTNLHTLIRWKPSFSSWNTKVTLINLRVWCAISANAESAYFFSRMAVKMWWPLIPNDTWRRFVIFSYYKILIFQQIKTHFLERRSNESYCENFVECCKCIVFEVRYFTELEYPMGPSHSCLNGLWLFLYEYNLNQKCLWPIHRKPYTHLKGAFSLLPQSNIR